MSHHNVRIMIDPEIIEHATELLHSMGLTVSGAVQILLTRIAADRSFPFDMRPNSETRNAMLEARTGRLEKQANVQRLIADLNALSEGNPQ